MAKFKFGGEQKNEVHAGEYYNQTAKRNAFKYSPSFGVTVFISQQTKFTEEIDDGQYGQPKNCTTDE